MKNGSRATTNDKIARRVVRKFYVTLSSQKTLPDYQWFNWYEQFCTYKPRALLSYQQNEFNSDDTSLNKNVQSASDIFRRKVSAFMMDADI